MQTPSIYALFMIPTSQTSDVKLSKIYPKNKRFFTFAEAEDLLDGFPEVRKSIKLGHILLIDDDGANRKKRKRNRSARYYDLNHKLIYGKAILVKEDWIK